MPPKNNSPHRTLPIKESGPDVHQSIKPFGSDVKGGKIIGEERKFKPNNNPAPGQYDLDSFFSATKPNAPAAKIVSPSNK